MQPLVSIIIPSYNSQQYLDETLESALNQTYQNIEIILVDDGSTDNTKVSFPRWEKLGIKCISQNNAGAAAARNHGMRLAKGDYLQFLDADDILLSNKIEQQVVSIKKRKEKLPGVYHAYSNWLDFQNTIEDGRCITKDALFRVEDLNGIEVLENQGRLKGMIATGAWLWDKAGVMNTHWKHSPNDDGEFAFDTLINGPKICVQRDVLFGYRRTSMGWSRINSRNRHELLVNCNLRIKKGILDSKFVSKNLILYAYKGMSYSLRSPTRFFAKSQVKAIIHTYLICKKAGISYSEVNKLVFYTLRKKIKASIRYSFY